MEDIKKRIGALGLPPEYREAAEALFRKYSNENERERESDARRLSELVLAVEGPTLKPNRASKRRQKFGKKRK